MVKTTVAGDMVVEKEMWESTEGAVRLPIVPFVFRRSRRHPYGRSQAKDLAQSEHLINRVRSLMFKSGLESIRPNGVSIFVKNLGPDDRQELENSFETGEPAFITGNMVGNDTTDIREIVMPHNFASSPLDPSLRQMMQMEMQAFRTNSFQGDPEDVGQARTGRAKRAQIQFNDRPKSLSVQAITRSVENVYDNLYELMRTTYNEKHSVTINGPQGRRQVTINEEFNEKLPVFDEEGNPKTDPQGGIILNELQMTLNSTNVDMKAQAETRGTLPHDMISRFQILRQLEEAGYVVKETSRDYILDDSLKLADDINRQKKQEQQKQQARQVLQQMAAQQRQRAQQGQGPQQVQQQQQQQSPGQAAAQGVMPEDVAQDRRQDLEDEGLDNQ
jgi:hypothetical protein